MDFKEQYKHPAWQKKRLEALNAADFSCANAQVTGASPALMAKRPVD